MRISIVHIIYLTVRPKEGVGGGGGRYSDILIHS